MPAPSCPNSKNNLNRAIARLAKTSEEGQRVERLLANAIVGALLPEGAVKGDSALKIRFGTEATRFSRDLDTARASSLDRYIWALEESLQQGWEGFTGVVLPTEPASPKGIPTPYVMQPFEVKLSYLGKPWMTVHLEVGHNEIGDADEADLVESPEIVELLAALGFPSPGPVPLMKLEHQVAQKLHGLSSPGSQRAHDLIDLQVIVRKGDIDYVKAKTICQRLFAYRGAQAWPPVVVAQRRWDEMYLSQAKELEALPSVEDAIDWANRLIRQIDRA